MDLNSLSAETQKTVLNRLSYREREIIKLRYGIGHDCRYTLVEVSRIMKTTVGRIRNIESNAERKIALMSQLSQQTGA